MTELHDLQEAVTEFASRATEKLRKQSSHAAQELVFIRTSPFRVHDLQYSRSIVVPLRRPSGDSRAISQAAVLGLSRIYQPGYRYAKVGVMLLSLQDARVGQSELDLEDEGDAVRDSGAPRLMQALDALNTRYGRGTVLLASAGLAADKRLWSMRQERKTPGYTPFWPNAEFM